MLHGVLLIALFTCAAFYISGMDWVKALSFSPMVVGIIIGMLYANSLRNNLPDTWVPGIKFCSKRILRTGIILYGFKLTFQDVMAVGFSAIVMDAIIVKMIRVMMLVPVLLVIAWTVARDVAKRDNLENTDTNKPKISIPWFAILFLVVIGFNSLGLLPESIVDWINQLDTFLLTMAMAALGAETSYDKFKKAGIKPFLLAAILYCWLIGGGYCLVKFAIPYLQE